jgi:hypothetical protein
MSLTALGTALGALGQRALAMRGSNGNEHAPPLLAESDFAAFHSPSLKPVALSHSPDQ